MAKFTIEQKQTMFDDLLEGFPFYVGDFIVWSTFRGDDLWEFRFGDDRTFEDKIKVLNYLTPLGAFLELVEWLERNA